ncbi:MAG TPA: malonyl-CoA decarboxylase [Hyphomicrobiaceae bacterium]|nr:malonyl-CoA decarboxylase [Hyphomicrobiaceae bacterium]
MPVNVSFLQDLLNTVAEQGRQLLPASLLGAARENITDLSEALVSGRGEASGVAIAREILKLYNGLAPEDRRNYFRFLADRFKPDEAGLKAAAAAYASDPSETTLARLRTAAESPRQEFFRRLNFAPGATAEIVNMRRDILRLPKGEPGIAAVDDDLAHLLASWFNRGFLVLRRIDWQTPAAILEKIIAYEAVHEIQSWEDLRRRLDPADRRCFAFFHPSLVDEPLIFVEVALMGESPASIQSVLNEKRKAAPEAAPPNTAVFYSISNCQEGLRGISFGNFLIKQVVEELVREQPQLKTFVTLSPVPHFARWLDRATADDASGIVTEADRVALQVLADPGWAEDPEEDGPKPTLLALAAHYFLVAKSADGRPVDPVARFHLGNGARLERINWLGDVSEKGLREAHGLMVNYRYDLKEIERNHEAYANEGEVAASRAVRGLLRPPPKPRAKAPVKLLPVPADRDGPEKTGSEG